MITSSRTLDDLDIRITAVTETAVRLRIERRQLAGRLNPAATTIDETERQQYSAAAYSLALDAIENALDASADPYATRLALRTFLDLDEAAPASRCVYDTRRAATTRASVDGTEFGLCTECTRAHDNSVAAEAAGARSRKRARDLFGTRKPK